MKSTGETARPGPKPVTRYRTIEVRNYRGFEHVRLAGLGSVNLITGANNAGKTALLEAVFAHCAGPNPLALIQTELLRGISISIPFGPGPFGEAPWADLFHNLDLSAPIVVHAEFKGAANRTLTISPVDNRDEIRQIGVRMADETSVGAQDPSALMGQISNVLRVIERVEGGETSIYYCVADAQGLRAFPPVTVPAPVAAFYVTTARENPQDQVNRLSALVSQKRESVLLDALRVIEPRLTAVRVLTKGGNAALYADVGLSGLIPLAAAGEGMRRITDIILGMVAADVVLIDEVEIGLHYSVMHLAWSAIVQTAESLGIQLIGTTHSLECIRAFHRSTSTISESEPVLFRLHPGAKGVRVVRYDREALSGALESGFEVR